MKGIGRSKESSGDKPRCRSPTGAPLCEECKALDLSFFSLDCEGCRKELDDSPTGISDIFAILRQWTPQSQRNIHFLVKEALRLGAHPDDRDYFMDMTLLMYICKTGPAILGDSPTAVEVAQELVNRKARLNLRCYWTDMSALHYAACFDSAEIAEILLTASKGRDVNSTSRNFSFGTPLHIAATNLSLAAAKVLLKFGADVNLCDGSSRKPVQCIPEKFTYGEIPKSEELMREMTELLSLKGGSSVMTANNHSGPSTYTGKTGKIALEAFGLKIGDRVLLKKDGETFGTLGYCGRTCFAPGVWAGVNLDEPEGKNDGSVQGVAYFKALPNHGIFVHPSKISKINMSLESPKESQPSPSVKKINKGRVDVSKISSKLIEAIDDISERNEIRVGNRVNVRNEDSKWGSSVKGTVRYVGPVDFVEDDCRWYGVELDEPLGKHDGTASGVRYFESPPDHGIFVTQAKLSRLKSTVQGEEVEEEEGEALEGSNHLRKEKGPRSLSDIERRTVFIDSDKKPSRLTQRSLSLRYKDSTRSESLTRFSSMSSSMATSSPVSRSQSVRRSVSNASASSGWTSVGAVAYNKFKKTGNKQKYLELGTTAMCIHNKEMGYVRYIGRVHFANGIWIGLELRSPKGKHDGEVEGKRYFTTSENHGIMLKPKMISVHGINAENLLKPEQEYPY